LDLKPPFNSFLYLKTITVLLEKKMKKRLLTVFILLALSQFACISMLVKSSIKDSTLNNKMLLHRGARVGDFAIYKGTNGSAQVALSITGISRGLYIVRNEIGIIIPRIGVSNTAIIDMYVDRYGNVKKGFLIDGTEKTPIKIAKNGQNEYLKNIRVTSKLRKELDIPRKITINGKTFSVQPKIFKSIKDQKETLTVYLSNARVKFLYVASYVYSKEKDETYTKLSAFELSEQGRR